MRRRTQQRGSGPQLASSAQSSSDPQAGGAVTVDGSSGAPGDVALVGEGVECADENDRLRLPVRAGERVSLLRAELPGEWLGEVKLNAAIIGVLDEFGAPEEVMRRRESEAQPFGERGFEYDTGGDGMHATHGVREGAAAVSLRWLAS